MNWSLFILRLVGWVSLLALIPLVISLFFAPQYTLISLAAVLLISKIGHAIGQHRYFSHRSFIVSKPVSWIIALLATLSTTGSIIHYCAIHRTHHRFSDTDNDPHNPKNGFIKTWFALLDERELSQKIPKKIIVDLLKIKEVMFFHNRYWLIIVSYVTFLFIIDPLLVLYAYLLPVGYSRLCAGLQSTASHMFGYRNFETSDSSTNSVLINVLTLGEGAHNNHHYDQKSFDFGFTGRLGEYDFSATIIRYLLWGRCEKRAYK